MSGAPYRIVTSRFEVRCWSPEDAIPCKRGEDESRAHLSTFMTWATNEQPLDDVVKKLCHFRSRFDRGEDFMYGVWDRQGAVAGGTGLHPRTGPGGLEIGYWVHPAWIRKGVATEIASALTRVSFELHEVRFVEIRCALSNVASAGIPRKLGFVHEATLPRRIVLGDGKFDDTLVFTMHADAYRSSSVAQSPVSAFDGAGRKVLG